MVNIVTFKVLIWLEDQLLNVNKDFSKEHRGTTEGYVKHGMTDKYYKDVINTVCILDHSIKARIIIHMKINNQRLTLY